ncbi:MAG TPA: hypothetical protein VN999_02895 [Thermoanaerobaculia bacterium]|nr:hypothetical protein [Thermoanaerobaculia bacterium]
MRRWMAMLLLPALATQGCASGGLPRTGGGPTATAGAADFEAVNRTLEEQPAIVELRSGESVHDVEDVKMTAESTSWHDGDRVRTVPTAEVRRVVRQLRFRAGKGFGWGAAGGAVVGYFVAAHQRNADNQVLGFLIFDLASGLAGMFVTTVMRQPPDQVVYVAPGAGAPSAGGAARRSDLLAPAPTGDDIQHCRLAARDARPGAPAVVCRPAPVNG